MLGKTNFTERFIELNGLDERGFTEWLLYPGMLFQATEQWWGDRDHRENPHEGLDLCYYRDRQGAVFSMDSGARIPVLYDGAIAGVIDDFLGKSLIVKHHTSDSAFCTIYGHTVPGDELCVGQAVTQGETIARVADARRSKSNAIPHLHISIGLCHLNNPGGGGCEGGFAALTPPIFPALLRRYIGFTTGNIPCEKLDWNTIGNPDIMTLVDPLQVIERWQRPSPDRSGRQKWNNA